MVEDFHEADIKANLTSKDKLWILYEYYSFNDDLLEKAIFFSYPSIFLELPNFVKELIEKEIIVKDVRHFLRFVVSADRVGIMKDEFEKMSRYLSKMAYERAMQELRLAVEVKRLYLGVVDEWMKHDNGDMGGLLLRDLLQKGYLFSEGEYQYMLKVELYSMFLYSLGRLSLDFGEFREMKIGEILHLFYGSRNIEDTPLLRRCFDVFGEGSGEGEGKAN